jgi:hypothetical protein
MYPAIEINLRLDHVCAAHASSLAASGYAFGTSTGGTNLLPLVTRRDARPLIR